MGVESPADQRNLSDKCWDVIDAPLGGKGGPSLHDAASLVFGLGVGAGTYQLVVSTELFGPTQEYREQEAAIDKLKADKHSVDETQSLIGKTAMPGMWSQLETTSNAYDAKIKTATKALPEGAHPVAEELVGGTGAFAVGTVAAFATLIYIGRNIGWSKARRSESQGGWLTPGSESI